jgi:hypothetical protein
VIVVIPINSVAYQFAAVLLKELRINGGSLISKSVFKNLL